jgi:hypothetical protein
MNILFPPKIGRLEHLVRGLALVSFGTICGWLTDRPGVPAWWFWGWFTIYCAYALIGLMVPRIRDAGYSPTYLLLFLVPVANVWVGVVLFFFPSRKSQEERPNQALQHNAGTAPSADAALQPRG